MDTKFSNFLSMVLGLVIPILFLKLFLPYLPLEIDEDMRKKMVKLTLNEKYGDLLPIESFKHEIRGIPEESLLEELRQRKAVFNQTLNLARSSQYKEPILFKPLTDEELIEEIGVLPNKSFDSYYLNANQAGRFHSPFLVIESGSNSKELTKYLENESYLKYILSTDSEGYRVTYPKVTSSKKALFIGDSVAMGMGVDDKYTIASYLQNLVGNKFKINNAGIAGNNTKYNLLNLKRELKKEYDYIFFIMCENDFRYDDSGDNSFEKEINVIYDFLVTENAFAKTDHFVLVSTWGPSGYLSPGFVYGFGTKDIVDNYPERFRSYVISKFSGFDNFRYVSSLDTLKKEQLKNEGVFTAMSYFIDEIHFSPLGSRLVAKGMYEGIKDD